ncbi:MAG: RHS repeat protein, partial [Thermoanaerobaculia bacterium]|nr:RHS repeat protein [Thermoanaerobaculia bacterium]
MQLTSRRVVLLTLALAAIASAAGASRTGVDGERLRLRHAERVPSRSAALDRPQREVTYDAAGRPISIADAMGTVVTQEFDAGNR